MLEDKFISLPQIKKFFVISICSIGLYSSINDILGHLYLYDLALEYKEHLYPNTLFGGEENEVILQSFIKK